MAPSPTAVGGLLRQVIHYHLDNASYDSALFFAERYIMQDPRSGDTSHLYALSHLRLGDNRSAYDAAKNMGSRGHHLGCSWVFAQACLNLERYKEGINALEKSKGHWSQRSGMGKHSTTTRSGLPDAAAVLCLLGKLYRGFGDKKKAVNCFEEALKSNPFMWEAFKALCDLGVTVRVPNIFKSNDFLLQSFDIDGSISFSDSKENIASGSFDPGLKNPPVRNVTADLGIDPFDVNASSDAAPSVVDVIPGPPENDFMSKIQAARSRLAASTNSQNASDGLDSPLGSGNEVPVSRSSQEPPQAPSRRIRTTQATEMNLDAPPKMNYKIGARRHLRPDEKSQDTPMDAPEASLSMSGLGRPPAQTTERKRTVSGHPVARPNANISDDPGTRRSARLNTFKPSAKVNSAASGIAAPAGRELKKARPQISRIIRPGSGASNVGRVVSGNRKPLDEHADVDHGEASRNREPGSIAANAQAAAAAKLHDIDGAKLEEAIRWTLDLVKKLGNGYYLLSRFQCQEAIQALSSLPTAQQHSPWVLAQLGRAHYEQASYAEAEKFYRKMRMQAPSRLEDVEMYSTVLWHLKKETDLSFLAHELVDSAWDSPQAWCALGNAWSLANDAEAALRCFKRATQLNPKFAYAFTLQGHEHVQNEEYEKALTAYRQAIAADKRHYNAYYGIGRVQDRLGAYEKAYTYFRSAQSINPNNAVLICCIGSVLESQKQVMPALQAYTKASELAPRFAQARFKKARALLAVGQIEAAQNELMILKDLAPDEARVHFLLGTLYRSMEEKQQAVRHFTIALALDPKVRYRCSSYHVSLIYANTCFLGWSKDQRGDRKLRRGHTNG